jgi:hypothetical protein
MEQLKYRMDMHTRICWDSERVSTGQHLGSPRRLKNTYRKIIPGAGIILNEDFGCNYKALK